jgi:hypothetical protein
LVFYKCYTLIVGMLITFKSKHSFNILFIIVKNDSHRQQNQKSGPNRMIWSDVHNLYKKIFSKCLKLFRVKIKLLFDKINDRMRNLSLRNCRCYVCLWPVDIQLQAGRSGSIDSHNLWFCICVVNSYSPHKINGVHSQFVLSNWP